MTGSAPNHIDRYQGSVRMRTNSEVIVESAVSLTVNGELWLTFRCTPIDLEALAAGFLFNEGVIQNKKEIDLLQVCDHGTNIDIWTNHPIEKPKTWQKTSGCTGGITSMETMAGKPPWQVTKNMITPDEIHYLVKMLLNAQQLYRMVGGVHTSVLSDGRQIITSSEDIGRHNTLDKICGFCLLNDLDPRGKVLLTTGRISSEMIQKAARMGCSIVVSRTSPSSLSILLAEQMGILLIGYARGNSFSVYSHPEGILVQESMNLNLPIVQATLSKSGKVL